MRTRQQPNSPKLKSFVSVDPLCHFPIQNLPYGIFSTPKNRQPRAGVAIGDSILDLAALEATGTLRLGREPVFQQATLNGFLALGRNKWTRARARISELLRHDNPELRDNVRLRSRVLTPMAGARLHLPVEIGGFSDFMLSKEHATNCLSIVGGSNGKDLWPNWHHLPMGYNSRASSIVVSGTPVRRPHGQTRKTGTKSPRFGVCRQLDFELETALVVGKPNPLGEPIPISAYEEHAFGIVLLNDWSARDIQQWEFVPLGAFNSKNFCTSISPWIVPLEALEPFRVHGPIQDPQPLAYLRQNGRYNIDARLEARLRPAGAAVASTICRTRLKTIYWSFAQQLAHHSSAGCNMRAGDLLASGTVSSSVPGGLGCLFEATRDGRQRIRLEYGGSRMYLEDGDEVVLTGWCQGAGYRIGFGQCGGRITAALNPR